MKKNRDNHEPTRRDFLRQSACASLGVTGLVNALAQMRLMTAATAQLPPSSEYKALICLFLNGGNDSNNLLVPAGTALSSGLRADYETGRGILAIPGNTLHALNVPTTTAAFNHHHGGTKYPLGVHNEAPGLASLFNDGDLAFVANVGTLAHPFANRTEYLTVPAKRPIQLFSHSDQQSQWQSSVSDKPFTSGWGGRAADLLNSSYNASTSKVSMSVSLAGINSFQVGTAGGLTQYVLGSSGTLPIVGFNSVNNDNNPYDLAALEGTTNGQVNYKNTPEGVRLKMFDDIMKYASANLHEKEFGRILANSRKTEQTVGGAILDATSNSGVNFDAIFTAAGATTSLALQLKMIAKLIAGRSHLGNNRQIFFCQVGGYDNHTSLISAHGTLIKELNNSLSAFATTLKGLGVWDNVVTYTASDFNRTFTPNASQGSDHAWGGHAIVMGGAVNGGDIYGNYPTLKTGAVSTSIDVDAGRGRWIPSTSVDQYSAVMAKWMGVQSTAMDAIFPNLYRFDDPFTVSTSNLAFL